MRNPNRAEGWLRTHWLEAGLLVGMAVLLGWFVSTGAGFVPKATPTPTRRVAVTVRAPASRGVSGGPTAEGANPRSSPTPTPSATQRPTATATSSPTPGTTKLSVFSGESAYQYVVAQTRLGPRPSGSAANQATQDYITGRLKEYGWQVEEQDFTYMNTRCRNLIAKAGQGPVVILGAHFDTRRLADNDPDPARRNQPVLGANDGASGVAVLLELARTLDRPALDREVWLTFFDAEDNGRLDGWDFIAGSRYMAQHLGSTKPEAVIVVDMIGDADQQIYREHTSTMTLQDQLWQIAGKLGYGEYFLPEFKYTMTDDHTPFLERGFAAQDLIDFDYPYWHTTADTADKVAPASLERVGRVLQAYLTGLN